jgi:lipopolysaccharide biosynthesis regulator YciM
VEAFTLLLKEFPKSQAAGQANYWIGLTAFQAKNYKDAVAPLAAARKQDADFADRATSLIIAAHRYLENRDALAKEVDAAGPKIRIPIEVYRWLGTEYLKGNETEAAKAEGYLTKLTGSEGDDERQAADWLSLGQARIKLRKWGEAEKALRTYLEQSTHPIPKANGYLALGEAELGAGKLDEALVSANKTQELQPEGKLNALGRMLAGAVTAAKGDWEGSAKLYLSVALVYDDPVITPQALEKAYRAYLKSGNEPQSKKVLNTLQSRYPEYQLTER